MCSHCVLDLCVWSVPLVGGGGQTASTFACINSKSAKICGCATLWGCFSGCFFVFVCLCPVSAASVWVLTGIRNKHRTMIQTRWIINTVKFLADLSWNNFVQINPEMPFSPDTDTGIWYWITGIKLGELTYPQNECLRFTTLYWHGDDHANVCKNFPFSDTSVLFILCGFQEQGKIKV